MLTGNRTNMENARCNGPKWSNLMSIHKKKKKKKDMQPDCN